MEIRIYRILKRTKVEGPDTRYCIWVQGCSKHCKGCFAKNTWDKNGGEIYDTDFLVEDIKSQKGLNGVTFLGGEPFEQAKPLSLIAKNVKQIGLSVITFTGNLYEDLIAQNDEDINNLLKYTDLLIDGGFEQENFDLSRPWVGSKNQRYIFLSDFYTEEDIKKYKNKIEVRISDNGIVALNGMGDFNAIEKQLTQNKMFTKIK